MRIVYCVSICMLLSVQSVFSQNSLDELRNDISFYSDIVANAALPSTKIKANKALIQAVEVFLSKQASFELSLDKDVWLSVKGPGNGSWRIITWECQTDQKVHYYGYIQHADGKFTKLNDYSYEMGDISYDQLDDEYWFGSLYYNIIEEIDVEGNPYYILFGFNRFNEFTNRKVAEVLTFDEGKPIFGKPVFKVINLEGNVEEVNRIYLEYSSDSNVTLNYNEGMGMIVYDHLISRMGRIEGQGPTMLPDGSYCGYKPENGDWVYVDKLFDLISETPPMPKPVIDKKNRRDLFGKKKN